MVEVEGMLRWYRLIQIFTVVAAISLAHGALAAAHAPHTRHSHSHHHRRRASGPVIRYHAALLEDADTGRVLYADNPNLIWPPTSVPKMMLLLVPNDEIA